MDTNKRVGDYEILEELGRGGMGRVYRVRNVISDRVEAMKVLLPDLVGREDLAARFLREIKVLATLDHPNIAELRTALTADNQLVMIMEFIEGESVANRLKYGPLSPADAVNCLDQVLNALGYAHAQHVIHRDIKPANMMVTPQGVVKLTDFGIARSRNDQTLTAAGTTTGSLPYMSPEQVNGEATDARSDLYSVGVSLYEMVTGEKPFHGDSDFAVMVAHLNEQPRPPIEVDPSLGPELNAVILKSLAKNPADRFQSAEEFRAALHALHAAAGALAATQAAGAVSAAAETVTIGERPAPPSALAGAPTVPTMGPPLPATPQSPPVPAPVAKSGHPAVYVALGAVLVIGVLVAAGLYIGRADAEPGAAPAAASTPASAGEPAAPPAPVPPPETAATTEPAAPSATAAADTASAAGVDPAAPAAAAPPASTDVASSSPRAAPRPAPAATSPRAASSAAAAPAPAPAAPTSAPASSAPAAQTPVPAVDFDELEHEIDQLVVRAEAVSRGLEILQQQQARQGLGLRGDIVARQQSMNLNLARAQDAITARNATRAQRFKASAEGDVEALERFLGR